MIAAYKGHQEMVQLLIEEGEADVNIKDAMGKRAQDRAKNSQIFYIISSSAIEQRMKTC